MVAFSRRGRKGRREEVEKLPSPSVSAEGSFRVFSGKTAKWNPSWERRSAEGGEKSHRVGVVRARHFNLPRSSLWPACPSSRAHPRAGGLLPRPRAPAPPATVLTRAGAARMPRPSPRSAYTSTPSGARPAPCGPPGRGRSADGRRRGSAWPPLVEFVASRLRACGAQRASLPGCRRPSGRSSGGGHPAGLPCGIPLRCPAGGPPSDHPPLRSAEPLSSPSPRPVRSSPQSVVGLFGAARAAGQNE